MLTAKGEVMSNRNRLRIIAVGLLSTALMSIGPALAWADDGSIIIDFVRHGESIDNNAGIIDTTPPGTALDTTGEGQASDIADHNPERVRDQIRRALRLAGAQGGGDRGAIGRRVGG